MVRNPIGGPRPSASRPADHPAVAGPPWSRPREESSMRLHRLVSLAAGAAIALALGAAVPTGAAVVPDDRPLPPYTISNPPLQPLTLGGRPTTVSQGVFHHAAYDMEIPPAWNGEL